jgi:hypothetical protein
MEDVSSNAALTLENIGRPIYLQHCNVQIYANTYHFWFIL